MELTKTEIVEVVRRAVREEMALIGRHDPDQLVPVEIAAPLVGVSIAALRKAAERGTIPARKIGRRLRFRIGDLLLLGVSTSAHKTR